MLAVAGLLVVVLVGGTYGVALGFGLTGIAAVGGMSLAFLAVGESEDREREERQESQR